MSRQRFRFVFLRLLSVRKEKKEQMSVQAADLQVNASAEGGAMSR